MRRNHRRRRLQRPARGRRASRPLAAGSTRRRAPGPVRRARAPRAQERAALSGRGRPARCPLSRRSATCGSPISTRGARGPASARRAPRAPSPPPRPPSRRAQLRRDRRRDRRLVADRRPPALPRPGTDSAKPGARPERSRLLGMCKSSPTTAWRWRAPPESGSRRRSTISPVATRSGGSWRFPPPDASPNYR